MLRRCSVDEIAIAAELSELADSDLKKNYSSLQCGGLIHVGQLHFARFLRRRLPSFQLALAYTLPDEAGIALNK